MERESLQNIDKSELVKRGTPFIEGMAQAFEGRNYLVMFTALFTTLCAVYSFWLGIIGGSCSATYCEIQKVRKVIYMQSRMFQRRRFVSKGQRFL